MTSDSPTDSRVRRVMKWLGFGRWRWFRKWYGGCWIHYCDFHTYICEQCRRPRRYPNQFVAEGFQCVLEQEDWR